MKFKNKKTGEIREWECVNINSSLLSAQSRNRLYWCNWKVEQPKDKGILLKDILENNVDNKYNISEKHTQAMINCKNSKKLNIPDLNGKCGAIIASYYKIPQDAPYIKINKPIRLGQLNNGGQADRVYSIDGKSVSLSANGGGGGAKTGLYDIENFIRKLTPIECERLQTLTIKKRYAKITIENKKIELEWLKECQKTDVQNVEEKCLKLQNAAGSVENLDLKGFVQYVEKNLNIKNQQINKPVQLNVHINLEELNIQIDFLKGLLKNVSCAEKSLNLAHQEKIEDFVLSIVGILIKLEKEVQTGRVELYQKDKQFILQRYGNNELKMFGEEIMQLAKNVEKDLTTHRKLLKSIILEDLNLKTQEKNLVILFCYVMNVINSFTPKETKTEILFQINGGYTYGISDTQRYKTIGNGWTVDVIAHIFNGLKQ